ncbi:transporter%2C DME family [Vibrio cholerae]|nr:transporter%2C DME family [Vibrio cholerae]
MLPVGAAFFWASYSLMVKKLSSHDSPSRVMTALAQWAIAKAYAVADASFVQPFDHAKLPLNVLAGWLVFGWVPPGRLWLGAAIIVLSVAFITQWETKKSRRERNIA